MESTEDDALAAAAEILLERMKPALIATALEYSKDEPVIVSAAFEDFKVENQGASGRIVVFTAKQWREAIEGMDARFDAANAWTLDQLSRCDPARQAVALIIINTSPKLAEIIQLD